MFWEQVSKTSHDMNGHLMLTLFDQVARRLVLKEA